MHHRDLPSSGRERRVKPTVPYTRVAPRLPPVVIPPPATVAPIRAVPCYDRIDPASLTQEDLAIITQNCIEQVAHDAVAVWGYSDRHVAQPILDYLLLGPSNVGRNRQWLREKRVTMIVAVRDARQAGLGLMNYDALAQEMGIEFQRIDITSYDELTGAYPHAIRLINDHMLRVYRQQAVGADNVQVKDGHMAIDHDKFRRGRVLVVCETGNERSASIVAAYLMAVIGLPMVEACQFINSIRFCVNFDDPLKHTLIAYEDILKAQRAVHQHELKSRSKGVDSYKTGLNDTHSNSIHSNGTHLNDTHSNGIHIDNTHLNGTHLNGTLSTHMRSDCMPLNNTLLSGTFVNVKLVNGTLSNGTPMNGTASNGRIVSGTISSGTWGGGGTLSDVTSSDVTSSKDMPSNPVKRGIDETSDSDTGSETGSESDIGSDDVSDVEMIKVDRHGSRDRQRFAGRSPFIPFADF
ncbi:putative dual specificity phosphatase [Rosellinia necatrix]|uniref:Putative dual specificity phosphatase n=1 Tax=Rosellinia necatrix TaxID=77044 RepID=A0A1S7UHV7_ROSNE|nr:putative dual specificity phosphatase [Rosellinia necatrix]